MNIFAERIRGTVAAPPSKSALHRRLILNRLAGRCDMPENACDDILATTNCLSRLGTGLRLDCGDCGATLRFLLPVSLLFGGAVLTGSDALAARPIAPLLQVLREQSHSFLVCRWRDQIFA